MITDATTLLAAAVRNNADWCDTLCRAHGLPGSFGARAWTNPRRTPPYYPDAVTLSEDATAEDVLDGVDLGRPGASVKDSYGRLDLGPGFRRLFTARWIHRPADRPGLPITAGHRRVTTEAELAAWARAWSGDDAEDAALIRPELLADPSTTIVGAYDVGGRVLGGAVLTESAGVTGVSNLFTADDIPISLAWAGALAAATPGLPVVGYESGDDLAAAKDVGFEELGPLTVWMAVPAEALTACPPRARP
ncbi:hypothetical protein [Streptomyces sp. NPDC094032]|uniref:hypothetical protein n=1 Tax=Streptomyces sp. NPDC094032 TaxID=3155308 RepID=UPI0033248049